MRTEVCGGIASGKTSLCRVLVQVGFNSLFEDFQSNPFWRAFYNDPSGTAFETELTFSLQHYHEIKQIRSGTHKNFCDFSLLLDLAYSRVTLHGRRLTIFEEVFREIWSELGPPELLVYLRCDPETELKRIRDRAREVEKSIDIGYLLALNSSLDAVITEYQRSLRILEIDSARTNFAELDDAKDAVRKKIVEALYATT